MSFDDNISDPSDEDNISDPDDDEINYVNFKLLYYLFLGFFFRKTRKMHSVQFIFQ